MNIIKNTKALITALMLFLLSGSAFAHGEQLRWNITPDGNIRVWIETYHNTSNVSPSSFPLNVTVTANGSTTTAIYLGTGFLTDVPVASLPDGGSTSILLSSCPSANADEDWVYFDFAPPACNTPVTLVINGSTNATIDEYCSNLYPQTITSSFEDVTGPVITANDLTVSASMNCDSAIVSSYGVTAADVCGYASGGSISYSISEGTVFQLGSTPVTVTATDSLNNTSTATFNVIVATDDYVGSLSVSVCAGNDFTYLDGTVESNIVSATSHISSFTRVNGCDSTVTESVSVINPVYTTNNADICYGDVYVVGDSSYTVSGTHYNTLTSVLTGCDSIVTSYLSVAENLGVALNLQMDTLVGNPVEEGTYRWLDCGNEYSEISGETTTVMKVTTTGNYALETTQNGCVDTTDCVQITLTPSFQEIEQDGDVYTGHADDTNGNYVVIFEDIQSTIEYHLINNGGVIITEVSLQNVKGFTLDMTKYEGGIYYLHVKADGPDHVAKIVN